MKTSPSKVNWRGQTRRKASESQAPEARKSHLEAGSVRGSVQVEPGEFRKSAGGVKNRIDRSAMRKVS